MTERTDYPHDKMLSRLPIKQRIIGIIVIILIMVSVVGMLTYQQFSEVLTVVNRASTPDPRVSLSKDLLYELSRAENNVKTYTLTQDSNHLELYTLYNDAVRSKLERLNELSENGHIEPIDFDSLERLVMFKFDILDELIDIQNEFRVGEAMDKVSEQLEQAVANEKLSKNEKRKKNFFLRFKQNADDDEISLEEINRNIGEVQASETSKEAYLLKQELELLLLDRENSAKIRAMLDELEKKDQKNSEQEIIEVEAAIRKTNVLILIFSLVICVLLIIMTYTIIQYISKSNRYRNALKQAKKEAEDLAKAKEHFVATVSHEIRTPMNIIAGFTEQVSQSKLDDQQRDQITTIQKAADHLLDLINEVLDFTKLQNNKLVLEKRGFRPEVVFEDVVKLIFPLAEAKNLKVDLDINPGVPKVLIGDAFRLRQILFNILGNAVKFTDDGTVSVKIDPLLQGQESVRMRIIISDSGIGMESDKISRVFEEFEQADAGTTRTYGGTGLGLSITKKLVELMEGNIEIESTFGKGTDVCMEIPFTIGEEKDLPEEYKRLYRNADLTGVSILIVDDEPFNRKLLSTILKKYNALVTEAENGQEAVQESSKYQYDLILMDARMPEVDGVTAAKLIRGQKDLEKSVVPIIALTAATSEEDRKTFRNSGMTGFLAKPFREDQLLEQIFIALDISEDHNFRTSEDDHADISAGFRNLRDLSSNDDAFYRDMLITFMDSTLKGLQDINQALQEKRWSEAADHAHRISAPCRHLSAEKLYRCLKQIEENSRTQKELENLEVILNNAEKEARIIFEAVETELQQFNN